MPPNDQTTHFANDLERLINRYRDEYDITYAQLVGVLHIQSFMLCREAEQKIDDSNEDTPGYFATCKGCPNAQDCREKGCLIET